MWHVGLQSGVGEWLDHYTFPLSRGCIALCSSLPGKMGMPHSKPYLHRGGCESSYHRKDDERVEVLQVAPLELVHEKLSEFRADRHMDGEMRCEP